MNEVYFEYPECGDCYYFRIDEETGKGFCRQTYSETNKHSSACDSFMED